MKIADALASVARLFLDSAPVIYFIEANPVYIARASDIFDRFDAGTLLAATSPITLAECLVEPIRLGLVPRQRAFTNVIVSAPSVAFTPTDDQIAARAADFRVRYNLKLPDCIQVATALAAGCDALLTNDAAFKRVVELPILVLDDLEL